MVAGTKVLHLTKSYLQPLLYTGFVALLSTDFLDGCRNNDYGNERLLPNNKHKYEYQ